MRTLAEKSLDTLAREIIGAPRETLAADYQATRAPLLRAPHRYWWEVNGLVASSCNEGAFILNTTTLKVVQLALLGSRHLAPRYLPEFFVAHGFQSFKLWPVLGGYLRQVRQTGLHNLDQGLLDWLL